MQLNEAQVLGERAERQLNEAQVSGERVERQLNKANVSGKRVERAQLDCSSPRWAQLGSKDKSRLEDFEGAFDRYSISTLIVSKGRNNMSE